VATPCSGDQANTLPTGFPKSIVSKTAWTGVDINNDPAPERYTLTLNQHQIAEVEQACRKFQGMRYPSIVRTKAETFATELGLALDGVSQDSFSLPTLGDELKTLAKVLTDGIGFLRIRGVDSSRYSSKTNVILYLGISSYIGVKRGRQDEYGNMLRRSPAIADSS